MEFDSEDAVRHAARILVSNYLFLQLLIRQRLRMSSHKGSNLIKLFSDLLVI